MYILRGQAIARVHAGAVGGVGFGNEEANARLIAAAPELLAALVEMRNLAAMVLNRQHAGAPIGDRIWSELYQATNAASGAIAKATLASSEPEA